MEGNVNSESAQLINVMVTKCDSSVRSTCKTESEVKLWMRDKYLYTVHNSMVFNADEFDDNTFTKVAVI